jgi:hypothetical protein
LSSGDQISGITQKYFCCFFVLFETGPHEIAQAGLELVVDALPSVSLSAGVAGNDELR